MRRQQRCCGQLGGPQHRTSMGLLEEGRGHGGRAGMPSLRGKAELVLVSMRKALGRPDGGLKGA